MNQQNNTEQHPSFGELLRYHRNQSNLTRDQLSDGICSSRYIYDMEKGDKLPTLFMMNQLCDKLHINLYDEYSLILQRHNLETHERMLKLDACVHTKDISMVRKLIDEYKDLEDFQYGEPYFLLTYFKCLVLMHSENDKEAAVSLAYNTLKESYPEIDSEDFVFAKFSNSELQLVLIATTYSVDIGKAEQSKLLYKQTLSYLKRTLSDSEYVVNRNRHFEINLYSLLYYNYFSDFHTTGEFLEEYLDFILDFQKNSKNEMNQSRLFFCKAYIYLSRGETELARTYYYAAYYTGLILLGEKTVNAILNKLFPKGKPFP